MCINEIPEFRTYCSDKCKHSDSELNAKRIRKTKNDKSKKLKCNMCGKEISDVINSGGHATKHLRDIHGIHESDYMKYYSIIDYIDASTKWKCPECNWESKDINNMSGWITVHVKKHYTSILEFNEKYPELQLHSIKSNILDIQKNSNIQCEICGEKLLIISNSHLKLHGITQKQYKKKYGNIVSDISISKLVKCGGTKSASFRSKGEIEICEELISKGYNVLPSYKKLGPEIDIFIPDKNIGIEFNGLYWHSELNGKDKKYHLRKSEYYEQKNVQLIHIFEDEWNNKKDIVLSRLLHLLSSKSKSYYARKCIIKSISSSEKNKFLNLNHLQGTDKSTIYYGAYFNDILVSVMTFSKPRISLGNKTSKLGEFELVRFCNLLNTNVVGIFSRFISKFIKDYTPSKISTYADRRFSSITNVYSKNRFRFSGYTSPNYFYMLKYGKRLHRYNFTKHKILSIGGNINYSEWENMQMLGYDRIWDCGSLKYELVL
jgi:DNA-directed RNA polymerase subunit RPC12/RpoP